MGTLRIKGVGVSRLSKKGERDKGDDGYFWSPEKNVAIVTDGITSCNGNGMNDAHRLATDLESVQNLRGEIRDAFFRAFARSRGGQSGSSTIAMLWLPEDFSKRALVMNAGDSHVVRVRQQSRGYVIEVLTDEHTIWDAYSERRSSIDQELYKALDGLKSKQEFESFEKVDVVRWLGRLRQIGIASYTFSFLRPNLSSYQKIFLSHLLHSCFLLMNNTLCLSLRSSQKKAREVIQNGTAPTVRPGDRFALVSDGIYRDVLELDEMLDILTQQKSAEEVAEDLVAQSHQKNIKRDDRVALVVDLIDE